MRGVKLPLLLALILLPVICLAADKTIEVTFSFDVPADKTVESYLLYRNGTLACTIPLEPDDTFECVVDDAQGGSVYTLAAYYTDATASPESPPYWFSFSTPRRIKIGGVNVRIVLIDQ